MLSPKEYFYLIAKTLSSASTEELQELIRNEQEMSKQEDAQRGKSEADSKVHGTKGS